MLILQIRIVRYESIKQILQGLLFLTPNTFFVILPLCVEQGRQLVENFPALREVGDIIEFWWKVKNSKIMKKAKWYPKHFSNFSDAREDLLQETHSNEKFIWILMFFLKNLCSLYILLNSHLFLI